MLSFLLVNCMVLFIFLLGQRRGGGHADHTGESGPVEAAVSGQK